MKLVKKVLNKFNGLYYQQEFLCLSGEIVEQPLHAYLVNEGLVIKDITKLHSFVGYHPLLFAISHSSINSPADETIQVVFTHNLLQPNEVLLKKDAIAFLTFKKIKEQVAGSDVVVYYRGIKGSHRFIPLFHQFIIQLYNRLYNKKPGNIYLPGNLYKQVQIAYSLPRNISLITVGRQSFYNLFPTDLHGPVNDDYYIISLRDNGKACQQVVNASRILLTQVHSNFYKTVYALGKNHMQDMKEKENYPFSNEVSFNLKLPLPQSALYYRELELQDSFVHGIHRLMLFKVLYRHPIQDLSSTLSHVHNVYATWRQNKRLPGNYLLR